ncbi:AraC family transcriptional regulator [Streptomyces inhibens]|uniref:AraC-like ligand-binding domain-containing protein n=1 Tax=Streptomyces inhibens TaxID=2293571 RepID=UPI00379FD6DF
MTESVMTPAPRTAERLDGGCFAPSDPGVIEILSRMPDEMADDFLYLGIHVGGSVAIARGGTKVFLESNDLVFCDPARRHFPQFGDDSRMTFFRVPRCYLGVTEADLDRVVGVPVRGGEGMGALVSDFLAALAAEAEFHPSMIGHRLARSAVDLLCVLVMELLQAETGEERSDASKAGSEMLSRIRAFISPSHFSRAFRDAYGMSPSEWQARAASGVGPPITSARDAG